MIMLPLQVVKVTYYDTTKKAQKLNIIQCVWLTYHFPAGKYFKRAFYHKNINKRKCQLGTADPLISEMVGYIGSCYG